MQTALTTVIALLSLSLVSCFLDKETFEFCFQGKRLRGVITAYMALAVLLLALALVELLGTAQAENYSHAGGWAQFAYYGCAAVSVSGFLIQAFVRFAIMYESQNLKTRAKEDNNHLSNSANRSVSSSEDSQQQELDTPKEDGREPQSEPKPKERAKDSDKEQ